MQYPKCHEIVAGIIFLLLSYIGVFWLGWHISPKPSHVNGDHLGVAIKNLKIRSQPQTIEIEGVSYPINGGIISYYCLMKLDDGRQISVRSNYDVGYRYVVREDKDGDFHVIND